jgi:hypothetical protein
MEADTTQDRQTRAIHMLTQLEGYEGSELAKSRTAAWDYYLQRPRGDEVEGRSPVVSGDVSAMVESTLSQVSEALSTDRLAEFEGTNDADDIQAQLEGAAVSSLVMQGKGWFRLTSAVKNALLLRMGVMRADVLECESVNVKAVENLDPLAHAVLADKGAKFADYDEQARTASIKVTEAYQRLVIRNVNAENFLFMQWPLDDFENIPACAERWVTTRQHLIDEEGISAEKADALQSTLQPQKSDDAAHSLRSNTLATLAVSSRQQLIEWFELFYLYDGERRRAIAAGNKVLVEKVVSKRPPFAIGVPFINPGRLDGFSIYDKLRSNQDITTALTRMLNDNANAVTMNRLAVIEGSCDGDQLTDQDPSGVLQIRASKARGDIRNALMPIGTQDLTAGIVTSLQYQRTVRAEMAGASLEVGTGQVQLPDRMGSMGLDRAYSASEQLSSLILKTFSQTLIKDLWLLCHELLRTQWKGPLNVKIDGRWVSPVPSAWPRREGVVVKPGMSPGERQRRSGALGNLIQLQTTLAQAGMEDVLVNAERYYRTVCDWARLNDLNRPEQYLIDPASPEAQRALAGKAQQAQAQAQQAQQLQQMAVSLEQMAIAVKKYGIDVQAVIDKYKVDSESESKEADLTIGLVKEREKAEREVKQATPEGKEPDADEPAITLN